MSRYHVGHENRKQTLNRMRLLAIVLLAQATTATAAEPRQPVVLLMRMEKNLPLVQVTVNGGETLTFILDSAAAGCVVDRTRAAALGLTVSGSAMSSGSGGAQQVATIVGLHVNLGGIEIRPALSFTFDMKSLAFKGPVDGILGFPLFGKYVVEIDYPGSRVRIFEPTSFRPSPQATVLPLRMTTGPVVRGSIRVRGKDPIEADMQLDTGSAHVLTLCTPFVDRHQLLDSADELVAGTTRGFGGAAVDIAGRIEEVRVGPFAANMPIVRFSRQTTGSFGTEQHYSANLGGQFMKAYKVTFDIPGSRLFLESSVTPEAPTSLQHE